MSRAAKSEGLAVLPGDAPLTAQERKTLTGHERTIEAAAAQVSTGFLNMAAAFHEIREQRLYRESSPTFAAYFREHWHIGRSHASRIADAGQILGRLSLKGTFWTG